MDPDSGSARSAPDPCLSLALTNKQNGTRLYSIPKFVTLLHKVNHAKCKNNEVIIDRQQGGCEVVTIRSSTKTVTHESNSSQIILKEIELEQEL